MLRPFLSEVREWLFPPEHNSAPRVDGKGGAKGGAANHLDEKRREVCLREGSYEGRQGSRTAFERRGFCERVPKRRVLK